MAAPNDSGSISEWNEGNLKSIRLHEAQEMINFGKISPLKLAADGASWNYEVWISGINILCGEGRAKYGKDELTQIDGVKELVELRLKFFPIQNVIKMNSIAKNRNGYIINQENWESLKRLIELYEHKTKLYNDKHGLSTRNREDMDDGL